MGDLNGAIADYSEALVISYDNCAAYWGRGQAYRETGNAEAALADLRRCLEFCPDAQDRDEVQGWIAELEAELSEP
jgi:tetratricopeptide (TPR) repeat protein